MIPAQFKLILISLHTQFTFAFTLLPFLSLFFHLFKLISSSSFIVSTHAFPVHHLCLFIDSSTLSSHPGFFPYFRHSPVHSAAFHFDCIFPFVDSGVLSLHSFLLSYSNHLPVHTVARSIPFSSSPQTHFFLLIHVLCLPVVCSVFLRVTFCSFLNSPSSHPVNPLTPLSFHCLPIHSLSFPIHSFLSSTSAIVPFVSLLPSIHRLSPSTLLFIHFVLFFLLHSSSCSFCFTFHSFFFFFTSLFINSSLHLHLCLFIIIFLSLFQSFFPHFISFFFLFDPFLCSLFYFISTLFFIALLYSSFYFFLYSSSILFVIYSLFFINLLYSLFFFISDSTFFLYSSCNLFVLYSLFIYFILFYLFYFFFFFILLLYFYFIPSSLLLHSSSSSIPFTFLFSLLLYFYFILYPFTLFFIIL